jgi:transmembrane sensor
MSVERPSATSARIDRALRAEAAAWIAKLHGPERSAELEEDFRAWLNADSEHARAFEHITEIWDAVGNVNVGGLPRLASDDPFDSRSLPDARKLTLSNAKVARAARSAWLAFAATLLIAAAGIASWLYMTRGLYTTDIGEQRIVSLDDGSRLYLNSDTRLDVELGEHTRRIQLQRGEAYFEVAKDPARPFIVRAGNRTVTALGTSFVVRYDSERTAVTLVEGKVTVALTTESAAPEHDPTRQSAKPTRSAGSRENPVVTLTPGERITFEPSGTAGIDVPRPESTAAWRRGEVVLDETPLEAAVEEMNRYQRQRLTLDDADIRVLPISGIYRTGNNQDFARAVATVYGLEVTTDGNEIHLHRK